MNDFRQVLADAINERLRTMSERELAASLGVGRTTLHGWRVKEDTHPNAAQRIMLEEQFGIPCNAWPKRVHAERDDLKRDWTGQRLGKLTVLRPVPRGSQERRYIKWECQCDCGEVVIRDTHTLLSSEKGKQNSSCDKCRPLPSFGGNALEGRTFGAWTALHRDPAIPIGKPKRMVCRCVCGNERSVRASMLTSGRSMSCGCQSTPWRHVQWGARKDAGHGAEAAE